MADVSTVTPGRSLRARIDKALLLIAAVLCGLAAFAPDELTDTLAFALSSLGWTAPFILFAVVAVAWLRAARAEWMLARAFEGREARMIVVAAFVGGLAPFCSCEVIPFVTAALAVGAPLGAVMAFWLASPLMDPAMFLITAGTLGTGFAVAKTAAAVGFGLLGGFATATLARTACFANPLRRSIAPLNQACCGAPMSASRDTESVA